MLKSASTAAIVFTFFCLAGARGIAATDAAPTDQVALDTPGRALPPEFLGFSVSNVFSNHRARHGVGLWTDANTASTLKALSASIVRFLGGQESNYWDWRAGWTQSGFDGASQRDYPIHSKRPFSPPDAQTNLNDTLENFKTLLSRSDNPVPLWDVNVLTYHGAVVTPNDRKQDLAPMIEDQVALLRAASAEGLPVKYVELGNEFYWGEALSADAGQATSAQLVANDQHIGFPTGADYGEAMKVWTQAVHKAFPDAKTAVVAAPAVNGPWKSRLMAWNDDIWASRSGADAISFHPYPAIPQPSLGNSPQAVLAAAFATWDDHFAPVIRDAAKAGLATWVTEFAILDRSHDQSYSPTWVCGLFISHMMIELLENPHVEMASYYDMMNTIEPVGHRLVGAGGTVVYFLPDGKEYFSPSGQALAIFGGAIKNGKRVVALKLSGSIPPVRVDPDGRASANRPTYAYPAVEGVMIEKAGDIHVVIVNYSATNVKLDFRELPQLQNLNFMESASADIAAKVYGNPIIPKCSNDAAPAASGGFLTLPPYSVNDLSKSLAAGCDPKNQL